MELEFKDNKIIFNKELSKIDEFVIEFVKILEKHYKYVIISGYVSILFGRNRATDDVDAFIQDNGFENFKNFYDDLIKQRWECLNSNSSEEIYNDFLTKKLAMRVAKKGTFSPNVELKFPLTELNKEALTDNIVVILNRHPLIISTIEQQIAFKLYLGSNKDLQDAIHIYEIFKDKLNTKKLYNIASLLNVENKIKEFLENE